MKLIHFICGTKLTLQINFQEQCLCALFRLHGRHYQPHNHFSGFSKSCDQNWRKHGSTQSFPIILGLYHYLLQVQCVILNHQKIGNKKMTVYMYVICCSPWQRLACVGGNWQPRLACVGGNWKLLLHHTLAGGATSSCRQTVPLVC